MKNITVSIREDIYQRARREAAARNTSVSRMVADYLTNLGNEEQEIESARERLRKLFLNTNDFEVGDKISREELHAR